MKIVFTGGGTAGHVMVNKILIDLLKKGDWEIVYIGSERGAEKSIINKQGIARYYSVETGKFRRYFTWKNVVDIFKVWIGIFQSIQILRKEKPNVVFSGGGFVTVPIVVAAGLLKIPVLIRETDCTIGLANKIGLLFAKKIFLTFPDASHQVSKVKSDYCGLIVRPELLERPDKKVKGELPTILVMGGSMGAQVLNQAIWNSIDSLKCRYNILHICGKGNINVRIVDSVEYRKFEYVEDMGEVYDKADIIVTRCGSNAISEGLALGKRMVCIPISRKSSRGEQMQNAKYACENGCAVILEEVNLTGDCLTAAIESVLNKPINKKMILIKKTLIANCQKLIHNIENQAIQNLQSRFIVNIRGGKTTDWKILTNWEFQFYKELAEEYCEQ